MIHLVENTICSEDVDRLIKWLKTYPRLTMGEQTRLFEEKWSNWLGCKYSVYVNSGSSANLLMLYSLIESKKLRNKKVVVPAVSWATDLAPVIQLDFEHILCDCNMQNLSIDLKHLEQIFQKESPSILLLVTVLGLVPDMNKIVKLCENYDVILIEDACESVGSKYLDKHIGTFGLTSSFSFYFGHHISTIEGGMVSTNSYDLWNILKSIRSHGWARNLDNEIQKNLREKYNVNEFNALYTFYYPGFNMRPTDLQAYIGSGQLKKIESVIKKRNDNYKSYNELINNNYWKPDDLKGSYVSNMGYPIIHPNRENVIKYIKVNNIECRPIICGSLGAQPFYRKNFGVKDLPNAKIVNEYGFYVPNNHELQIDNIEFISSAVNKHI